ncbi:MAG: NTP transferase domain-containing protein [Elusimicrobia bacterium]|nr:NTP transferase domain-containing protein [Elusimicrobiota bacterium]
MFAGIIAAGSGERLKNVGGGQIKPLLNVGGKPLITWPVGALAHAGVKSFIVLSHTRGVPIQGCLTSEFPHLRFRFLFKDTASSWESFRLVSRELSCSGREFVLGTADAVYAWPEASRFLASAKAFKADAVLGLTSFIDDEKPLWVELDSVGRVTALGAKVQDKRYATSGLYYVTRDLVRDMPSSNQFSSLRAFWAWAVANKRVYGVPLSKAVDVDRPEDIAVAEDFLRLCAV